MSLKNSALEGNPTARYCADILLQPKLWCGRQWRSIFSEFSDKQNKAIQTASRVLKAVLLILPTLAALCLYPIGMALKIHPQQTNDNTKTDPVSTLRDGDKDVNPNNNNLPSNTSNTTSKQNSSPDQNQLFIRKVKEECRREALEAIKENWKNMRQYEQTYGKDKDFMLEVVESHYQILLYATDELKKDKDLVRKAVEFHPRSFTHADPSLQNDRQFVLKLLELTQNRKDDLSKFILFKASDTLKKDKDVVRKAVKNTLRSFRYADISLRNDKEFVLELLKEMPGKKDDKHKWIFPYASDTLKKDKDIMNLMESLSTP